MTYADLHLHSNHSDGSDTPEEVVAHAFKAGVGAMALTDHDTLSGVARAAQAARDAGIGFLHGTEISARYEHREIHVIALGVQIDHPELCKELEFYSQARNNRAAQIIEKLEANGIPFDHELLQTIAGHAAIGRMHIAKTLTLQGIVKHPQQAFDRFLNARKPAYVPKLAMPMDEAIQVIHAAGGLAFVAHPGLGKTTRKLLPKLLTLPFDGIEAYHVSHTPGRTEEFLQLAQSGNLLVTGGSDCHGDIKGKREMGNVRMPLHHYETLCETLETMSG